MTLGVTGKKVALGKPLVSSS